MLMLFTILSHVLIEQLFFVSNLFNHHREIVFHHFALDQLPMSNVLLLVDGSCWYSWVFGFWGPLLFLHAKKSQQSNMMDLFMSSPVENEWDCSRLAPRGQISTSCLHRPDISWYFNKTYPWKHHFLVNQQSSRFPNKNKKIRSNPPKRKTILLNKSQRESSNTSSKWRKTTTKTKKTHFHTKSKKDLQQIRTCTKNPSPEISHSFPHDGQKHGWVLKAHPRRCHRPTMTGDGWNMLKSINPMMTCGWLLAVYHSLPHDCRLLSSPTTRIVQLLPNSQSTRVEL